MHTHISVYTHMHKHIHTYNIQVKLRSGYGCDDFTGCVLKLHHVNEGVVKVGESRQYVLLEAGHRGNMRLLFGVNVRKLPYNVLDGRLKKLL